ncbi:MAG: alpha/beta hydrolase [Vulcanimicrobiaceae bacterium]
MKSLFIHGSGCSGKIFRYQTAHFAGSHAPDLPGHDCAGAVQTVGEFADFIEHYLQRHGLEDAILCGNSLGGAVALEVGLRNNPRVRALIALGSGARLRVAPAIMEGLRQRFDATATLLAGMMFASPSPELTAEVIASMQSGGLQTVRDFDACDAFDVTERLADLSVPLLALTGEQDVMTPPKYAAFLAGRVPTGQMRIIPGAGHLAMIERPAETNDAIADFVEGLK